MTEKLLLKAAKFVANEMIEGDYLEFGIYQGASMVNAANAIRDGFERRINTKLNNQDNLQRLKRENLFRKIQLVGFDSFEGLPKLTNIDSYSDDFKEGQYSCGLEYVKKNIVNRLTKINTRTDNIKLVKGWFEETVNASTFKSLSIDKAAIINIDSDLYSSASTVLNEVVDLIHDGTVLIFDDWFAFKGNPNKGEQRAFAEWKLANPGIITTEFHSEGVYKKSFICHRV
tara:strand:- start:141 stop:827 length:687 start_codon:yes stop_codon:yes gene_type:complete